ncbi:hypothetical protein ACWEOE_28920 [Amycolatopsis sp. NPDC004368]
MQYRANYVGMGRFLRGPDARRVTTLAAGRVLAQARAIVRKDTGETAASGRLLHGTGGRRKDRVRVTVAFGGAAVPLQFGNKRTKPTRFLTRAIERV